MKILFAHDNRFIPVDGDVFSESQFSHRLWGRYLAHFDEMTVFARQGTLPSHKRKCDLEYSEAPGVSFVFGSDISSLSAQLTQRKKVRQKVRSLLANAVVARLPSELGFVAIQEAEREGVAWAVEVVGDTWDSYWNYGTLAGKLYAPIAWWRARRWISKAPYAIYVTREHLQKRYPCNGTVSYASNVEIQPVQPEILQNRLSGCRKDWLADRKRLTCGMIGSLASRYKGLHVALKALNELRTKGVDVHLHVLGGGDLDAWMGEAARLGVEDLLHLDGLLPGGDPVFKWLDGLDFYIQPSYSEGLPRGLIEAMSRGLPALASTCGGIPELLRPDCLHRPGDSKKLAADMGKLIRNTSWRINLAQHNFREAENYYAKWIERRRNEFWRKFSEFCKKKNSTCIKNY